MSFDSRPGKVTPAGVQPAALPPSGGTSSATFGFQGDGSFAPAGKEVDKSVFSYLGIGAATWHSSSSGGGQGALNPVGHGSASWIGKALAKASFSFAGAGFAAWKGPVTGTVALRAPFFTTDTIPGPVSVQLFRWVS